MFGTYQVSFNCKIQFHALFVTCENSEDSFLVAIAFKLLY